ncbi:c-type cytochrome [Flavisolibacter ginsenosidimutans]|uniref:C-type cytochrome n=1 Tax=Flavisolibacter ginsenosidimutans TaxID=661481 RepID=A0A5B8UHR9_9BACT|nr:c-type cytochrome [Flavisolibacter ginsenosidimutans]QEC55886.1 c-type cytochrome [Flavisolibacter ginsenosidimutans]
MRNVNAAAALAAIVLAGALYACSNAKSSEKKEEPIPTQAEMVKRGEYLVNSIGCDDCHSPKRMGAHGPEVIPETRFGGYPASRPVVKPDGADLKKGYMMLGGDLTSAVGPWGISFAANISSDETGIGNWTEQNFITAIRHGKSKGLENGRDLLPPMPWFNFAKLTDEDLKSVFAYLKSTTPVSNVVPAPIPPTGAK